jgi:thymidylate kinase
MIVDGAAWRARYVRSRERGRHERAARVENRHAKEPAAVLITFSGLDGAGKSTLIQSVAATLQQAHRPVAVLHLNDDVGVYAYLRWLRDRLGGHRVEPLPPGVVDPRSLPKTHGHGVRGALSRLRAAILWNESVRRFLYPIDLVLFLLYRAYLEKVRGRVLIMDRYFYDTLVDVAAERERPWTRLLERITPRPTLPVFLDVTPEESHRRKGEFSVEYLRRRYAAYQQVFARVPGALRIANTDLAASSTAVLRAIGARNGAA